MALPKSFFSTGKPVQKEIEVNGEKHTVFVRKPTAFEQQKFYAGYTSQDKIEQVESGFYLISVCLLNEDGTPAVDFEKAKTLDPAAHAPLIAAMNEVTMGSGQKKA